ncbi:MAG: BON domain-containing protein [Dehalococcoidales bacterium]|nr:BON domain-containing protein [Dehalococcoidales bacterium]
MDGSDGERFYSKGPGREDKSADWIGSPSEHEHLPGHRLRRGGLRPESEEEAEGGVPLEVCPVCGRTLVESPIEGPHRGKGPARRSDAQVRADVEFGLTEDSWLDASGIDVQVQGGIVTLKGIVGSDEDKLRAERLAHRGIEVKGVQNELAVTGS